MHRSDYKRALDILSILFESPINNDSVKYAAYKNRGWAFLGLQQYELAEKEFKLAMQVKDTAEVHCMLGEALRNLGNRDDAIMEWSNCLAMRENGDPYGIEAYWLAIAMTGVKK